MNEIATAKKEYKLEWQRNHRREFKEAHGFSTAANYSNGKIRLQVLGRDGHACVKCGMTDDQHKAKWNRPITVDHIDKNRKNNAMDNLRTMCLSCHGQKDQLPRLRLQIAPIYKTEIITMRAEGKTYQQIAEALDKSIATIWKWLKKWEGGGTNG